MSETRAYRGAFARAVREIRVARGLRQEDVQQIAGLSRNYLTTLERGYENPRLETIAALARGLGVTLPQLINATEAVLDASA